MTVAMTEKKRNQDISIMVKNVVFTLYNVARSVDYSESDMTWLVTFSLKLIVNHYLTELSNDERLVIFMFLVRSMTSSELGAFGPLNEFVIKIVQALKSLSGKLLMNGGRMARMSVCSSEMYERVESVYMCVAVSSASVELIVSIVDLLECVQVLNTKKLLPWELVRNLNLADDLKTIVENGNECEVENALKVIFLFFFLT